MRTKHARSIRLGILYAKEVLALGLIPDCRDFEIAEDIVTRPNDSLTLYSFYNYLYSRGFWVVV